MIDHNDTLCLELHHIFSNLNSVNDSIRYRRQDGNSSHDVITSLADFRQDDADDESTMQPLMEFAKYYLAGVVNPALCAFGLIGNIFNVIVLSRKQIKATLECSMELAAHTGLLALAVSDMLYCVSALLHAVVNRHQTVFDTFSPGLNVQLYASYLQNVFLHTGTWLTVIMAVGRYAAICRPLQARHLIGVRPTRVAVVTTFVVWTILDLPKIWTYQVVSIDCAASQTVAGELPAVIRYYVLDHGPLVRRRDIKTAFTYVWATVGFFVPVVTLSFCNIHLILALRESIRVRRLYRVNPRATSPGSRISPTLVAIVCMYLVLITPSELLHFYYYTVGEDTAELFTMAIVLTNVLQTTNFAFNFVLYCIVNVQFRRTCVDLVVRTCSSPSDAGNTCCCCCCCFCCCRGYCARPTAQSHSILKASASHKGRRRSSGVLRRSWHSSSAGSYCTREYLMTHGGVSQTAAGSSACETVL